MLLSGSLGAFAQDAPAVEGKTLSTVTVREKAEPEEGRDSLRVTRTGVARGTQDLRDIPQSVTVITEKLMDDRNLDTLKQALQYTAGISFLAAEGGEEDIRLRGYSLQATGDIFVDVLRDPGFYDRDTFNFDRIEVIRGSASMLFGRGSTGGAVNQVSKVPRLMDENQVDITVGSHNFVRITGDFNAHVGENAALRVNVMGNTASNDGAGNSIRKGGIAGSYRWGIGERDEFTAALFYLDNHNGINYGLPWIRPTASSAVTDTRMLPLDPSNYYGMASDTNQGSAGYGTLSHQRRLDDGGLIKSQFRVGNYERDQRASTIRLCQGTTNPSTGIFTPNAACPTTVSANLSNFGPASVLTRGTQLKIQNLQTVFAQSDYINTFNWFGVKNEVLAGVDYALEKKQVYAQLSAAQGGYNPAKPPTTAGTPDDGAWINESARVLRLASEYQSQGIGIYAQDLVQVAPTWKVLGGLRYDYLAGDYDAFSIPTNASGPTTTSSYRMRVSEWSWRLGALYQPNPLDSYYASGATSFNTSGDAYSLNASNQNIPPEQSANVEVGAKLDSADKRFTTRLAAFYSTKYHERNTDPDVNLVTLSGKRHVAGAEIELTGRLTREWEMFGSFMWMPIAVIDAAAPGVGVEAEGSRPSLTPVFSGTLWNTYQINSKWRVGLGVNFRGEQTPNRNPGWTVPGYVTADLMAEYTFSEKLSMKGYLSNLANTLYANALYTGHYVPGAGRLFQLTASLKF
jgi:catecholate siderophore receptor